MAFIKPVEAIGKILYAIDPDHANKACPIVGMVAGFYGNSLHQAMLAVVIGHVQEREKRYCGQARPGWQRGKGAKNKVLSCFSNSQKRCFTLAEALKALPDTSESAVKELLSE